MKLTVSKSKNSASFYVQKSVRREDGSVTSVTVEKLGNIDEVTEKAGGGDPYVWAQEYVDELNRKEYEQQKAVILSFAPGRLLKKDEPHTANCGSLFIQDILRSMGLDEICREIAGRHSLDFDLDGILSALICRRILSPASERSSGGESRGLLGQPAFSPGDADRALSVLAAESDRIQSSLYKKSQAHLPRRGDILCYDSADWCLEIGETGDRGEDGTDRQHRTLSAVGMGLFTDCDGIPLAFDIYPGDQDEQPALRPLEESVLRESGRKEVIVCADAGLSSGAGRRLSDRALPGTQTLRFIAARPVSQMSGPQREFALDTKGWHLPGDDAEYDISRLDRDRDRDRIFYKDEWIDRELSPSAVRWGSGSPKLHLIVTFSLKERDGQRHVRQGQIDRARKMAENGAMRRHARMQNDPQRFISYRNMADEETLRQHGRAQDDPQRFISYQHMTDAGESGMTDRSFPAAQIVAEEARYDGFRAVYTNVEDVEAADILQISRRHREVSECFRWTREDDRTLPGPLHRDERIRAHFLIGFLTLSVLRTLKKRLGDTYTGEEILETLRHMDLYQSGEKMGWIPCYTRTGLTDALHEAFGFRTDYEIIKDGDMKKLIRQTRTQESSDAEL